MSDLKSALRIVAIAAVAVLSFGSMAGTASAAEKQISHTIGKEIMAAQKALQAKQWNEALKNLEAASGKAGITSYDKTKIAEFKGYAFVGLGNSKSAMQAFEQAMAQGTYTPDEVNKTNKILFTLAASSQNYPATIDYGKKLFDAGTATTDTYAVLGQTYYLQKDCKNANAWLNKAIDAAHKAGEAPKEAFYQIKLRCAFDANDTPNTVAALEELVKLTNKTEYWNQLTRFLRQDEKDDRGLLMIYRVMYSTNSMNALSDYVEMSQLLLDAALPGEAQAVLEKAFANNLVTPDQKDRTTRLLNSAKQRAEADHKGLAQFESEATKNKVGENDVKLGEVYYGFGDFQNAVTSIKRGFEKGQIKHLDEANVYLGLSEAALKNSADAKKAFLALKTVPGVKPNIAKLWELYAEKQV